MTDRTDSEMTGADAPYQQNGHARDYEVKKMLPVARQLLDQGKPYESLRLVLTSIMTSGGDGAVGRFLQKARKLYEDRREEDSSVDSLSSLFADCALFEANEWSSNNGTSISTDNFASENNSILAETGGEQLVLDASADGNSFICSQCVGLAGNHRKSEQYAYWSARLRDM